MEFFHFCNGLCYNWQEAITLNSFHIIPFYWVVWSLFSIKDLKEFRNGFFFCPAISFSCRALGGYFSRTPISPWAARWVSGSIFGFNSGESIREQR